MPIYTPLIITRIAPYPPSSPITLPSPDRVTVRPESTTFTFDDPVDQGGNGVQFEDLVDPFLCRQPGQPWLTRGGQRGIVVAAGGVKVEVEWSRVEPFDASQFSYVQFGALILPEWVTERRSSGFTLILYLADVIYERGTGTEVQ
jgi:hypothetical protein